MPAVLQDVCSLRRKVGPGNAAIPRVFFNPDTEECEEFLWGGASPNGNNWQTLEQCEATCKPVDVCELPVKSRPCRKYVPRFFYSNKTQECERFGWGGCQPNGNNFETLEECEDMCKPVGVCGMPKKAGGCKVYGPRFFFNNETEECESFIFGGCGPNGNNFKTLEECEDTCEPTGPTRTVPAFGYCE